MIGVSRVCTINGERKTKTSSFQRPITFPLYIHIDCITDNMTGSALPKNQFQDHFDNDTALPVTIFFSFYKIMLNYSIFQVQLDEIHF